MADESIGQYLNRIGRAGVANFGDEVRTYGSTLRGTPGFLADAQRSANQQGDQFVADLAGDNPYVPEPPAAARLAAARAQGLVVQPPAVAPGAAPTAGRYGALPNAAPGTPLLDPSAGYMGGNASGGMSVYDTPKNPGSISYRDSGGPIGTGSASRIAGDDAALAGLRMRAMRTSPMDYPDTSQYNYSRDEEIGASPSHYQLNPLLALSAGQIAQDEGVRTEREARYGNARGDALAAQKQQLEGEQLRYQMEDPLGLDMKRKLAQIELEKLFGLKQGEAALEQGKQDRILGMLEAQVKQQEALELNELHQRPDFLALSPDQRAVKEKEVVAAHMQRRLALSRENIGLATGKATTTFANKGGEPGGFTPGG